MTKYEDLPRNAAKPIEDTLIGHTESVRFIESPKEENPFDKVAAEVLNKPLTFRAIDYIRPDWALLRGIQFQHARRHGQTGWLPTARTPRTPGRYKRRAMEGRYHRKHQS